MTDLLIAVPVFALLVSAGLALLAAVTIAPFVVALQLADRHGLSAGRVGAAASAVVLVGLAGAGAFVALGLPLLAVAPLVLCWVVPLALRLPELRSVFGRAGRHEQPAQVRTAA